MSARTAQPIAALVASDGTGAFVDKLLRSNVPLRDLADAVHALCAIHCHHPGVVDHAAARGPAAMSTWLDAAVSGFGIERAYLAQLTAAVGPVPSTPGQADAELALTAQRHALDMLAHSDRSGCAFGAAAALILDWHAIRRLLDRVADRTGATIVPLRLPDIVATSAALELADATPAVARAAAFGAHQLIAQHRGLWQLLEVRIGVRHDN